MNKGVDAQVWRPYSSSVLRDEFACVECGGVKGAYQAAVGWMKRFMNGRTERRCPSCSQGRS